MTTTNGVRPIVCNKKLFQLFTKEFLNNKILEEIKMYEWEISDDGTMKRAINKKKKKLQVGVDKQEVIIRKNAKSAWIPITATIPESSWIEDAVCVKGTIAIEEDTVVQGKGVLQDSELKMCHVYGTGYSITKTIVQDICTLFLKDDATLLYCKISNAVKISGTPKIVLSEMSLGTEIIGSPHINGAHLENHTVVKDKAIIEGKAKIISSTLSGSCRIFADDSVLIRATVKDDVMLSGEQIHIKDSVLCGDTKIYSHSNIKNSSLSTTVNEKGSFDQKISLNERERLPMSLLDAKISSQFDFFSFRFKDNNIVVYRTIDNTFNFSFENKKYDEKEISVQIDDVSQQIEYDGKGPGYFCWVFWCQNQETLKKYYEDQVSSIIKTFRSKARFSGEDINILSMITMWSVLEFMCFLRSYTMDNIHYLIGQKEEEQVKELGSLLSSDLVVNIKTKSMDLIATRLFLKRKTIDFLAQKTHLSDADVLKFLSEAANVICTDF